MVILHKGDCLNCFSCDSISNRDCAELSFSSDKYVTNCSVTKSGELRESPVCYKATGKVNLMITEGEVVIRGCGDKPRIQSSCESFDLPYKVVELKCDICLSDKCNGEITTTARPAHTTPPPTPSPSPKGGASAQYPIAVLIIASIAYLILATF